MEENKEITPKEELENIIKIFSQISGRLSAYASSEEFKAVKGNFQQAAVKLVESSMWTERAYLTLFTKVEEKKEEPKEEVKEEKPSETN